MPINVVSGSSLSGLNLKTLAKNERGQINECIFLELLPGATWSQEDKWRTIVKTKAIIQHNHYKSVRKGNYKPGEYTVRQIGHLEIIIRRETNIGNSENQSFDTLR